MAAAQALALTREAQRQAAAEEASARAAEEAEEAAIRAAQEAAAQRAAELERSRAQVSSPACSIYQFRVIYAGRKHARRADLHSDWPFLHDWSTALTQCARHTRSAKPVLNLK